MKKIMLSLSALGLAVVFSGCMDIQYTSKSDLNGQKIVQSGTNVAHINAQNSGFYFLKYPIATGSAKAVGSTAWFSEDSVNVPAAVNALTAKSKELGATQTLDLQSEHSSFMIPFPFPFLFYMKSVNVSGNAVK